MAATVAVFDSLHSGPLHCVEFDFFASRLATASSDRTIRLWHVHPQSNDRQQQLVQASPGSLPHELLIDGAAGRGSGGVGRGGTSTAAKATLLQELHAHEGPVWQVRWAHPSFGNILASCGYDKRIVVWQQEQRHGGGYGAASFGGYGLSQEPGTGGGAGSSPSVPFVPVYSNEDHAASVNALAFAPPEWGLMLAAGSSDGSISVLMHFGEGCVGTADLDTDAAADRVARAGWTRQAVFSAHFNGVYAVAWAPACPLPLQGEEAGGEEREGYETADVPTADSAMPMLASGGADCQVRIWGLDRRINSWRQLQQLKGSSPHTDWVRDVAFQPASAAALLLPSALLLASCSEDSTVKLWVYDPPSETRTTFRSSRPPGSRKPQWRLLQTLQLHAPVWRIAWSASGTLLAAACGDEDVALFRESVSGVWETVSKISGPPPMQMLSGIQLQEDQQQQQQTFQEEAVQQRGIQEHGVQQGLQQRRLSQQGLQQPGLHQQGLQQPELQQHGLQQHGMQQRSMQEPPAAQHASTPGLQGAPLRLQQVLGPQQQPLQMQTPQQQPQPLNMSLRYPRPQGAQQQQQQQATPPISLFPPSQRPPSMQEPPLTKQMQQQGMAGSAPYEGAGFPGGPYPAPGGGVQGMRPQQQQVGQIQPSKAPVSPIPCTRGPSVVSQQAAPGAPGTAGSTPQPFAASNCPVPLPGPLHLVAAPARQQSFPQQPLSQQQPQALQQQAPQQHQGPPGTLVTGGGAPPLPPSFISAPLSHSTPGVPTQSGLPPVGPMQQPRTGVNVNPFQVYQTGGAPVPPSQQPHQQPGMTRAHLLTPPPPTGAGLTPPVSMQQHAFASGGARQQQSLYTPYKTN